MPCPELTGQGINDRCFNELVCNKAEDRTQDISEDLVLAVVVSAIRVSVVISVFISASETFAEVVVVFVEADVVRVIPVARILIAVRRIVVVAPTVISISLACSETFFVAVLDRILDLLSTVRTCVIPRTAAVIAVVVVDVVVVPSLLEPQLILSDAIPITLLILQITHTPLLFELTLAQLLNRLPISPAVVVLLPTLIADLTLLVSVPTLIISIVAPVTLWLAVRPVVAIISIVTIIVPSSLPGSAIGICIRLTVGRFYTATRLILTVPPITLFPSQFFTAASVDLRRLTLLILDLTLLPSFTLLLLPSFVTLLNLLAAITSPVASVLSRLLRLSFTLLRLCRDRRRSFRTLYLLTLRLLLSGLTCRSILPTISLFFLALLAAIVAIILPSALGVGIDG